MLASDDQDKEALIAKEFVPSPHSTGTLLDVSLPTNQPLVT
jgi:hypothetical protein